MYGRLPAQKGNPTPTHSHLPPPQVYTPEENAGYWQTRPVAVVTRTLQISAALGGCRRRS